MAHYGCPGSRLHKKKKNTLKNKILKNVPKKRPKAKTRRQNQTLV